ncbi:hypothetical protein BGZ61DRAFT_440359 [Ilyonectria robusta]|uniref:uncharacterized protein n=1 Tax=Ilyonectria robusta TaxID=1079257 RepID=UPI001E8D3C64|nr:uncharacterized protein BGZ61DRAFT_440359 [Ilyonectria robusta]KAH8735491.1 hypothetical protein BGZ61DRAFT_440359 [Ilyonectria robusta]
MDILSLSLALLFLTRLVVLDTPPSVRFCCVCLTDLRPQTSDHRATRPGSQFRTLLPSSSSPSYQQPALALTHFFCLP